MRLMSEQQPSVAVTAAPESSPQTSPPRSSWARRILTALVLLYAVALVAVWGALYFGGDRWWLATVMLFGPRWIYGVPLPLLALASTLKAPRLLWILAALTILQVGPIMRFNVPWTGSAQNRPTLRILTFNIESDAVDTARLMDFIREIRPDIVALQEFPHSGTFMQHGEKVALDWPPGWHVVHYDEYLLATRLQ